ncbi:MAG: branched-chain-amino-acid transaminase [Phycisphaerales bacterium]|nr:branched-chain-amino-acid transaminase [Phycisphaerales bacterium]
MSTAIYGVENLDPKPHLKIWMNGQLVPVDQARINVFDHGLLYGDGVFEGIRSYNGRIFECEAHVHRLFNSAKAIKLTIPFTEEQVAAGMYDAMAANGHMGPDKDCYLRVVVTRGVGLLGISPLRAWKPTLYIIADTILMYPREMYEKGMPVVVSSFTRNHSNAMPPSIKSLNYLNNILAKLDALEHGFPEAIMLNHMGYVSEATGDNIFLVRDGQLQTPPTSAGILEGITRNTVIRLAREMGIEAVEKEIVRTNLYYADEIFLTGTGAEIIGVREVDRRPVGDGTVGPITRRLMDAYQKHVRLAAVSAKLPSGVRV